MSDIRPFAPIVQRLRQAGLRPTRQRLSLAKLLFSGFDRHLTADDPLPVYVPAPRGRHDLLPMNGDLLTFP